MALRHITQFSTEIYADSGTPQDIQRAVNYVNSVGGGVVHVPAGRFTWYGETVTYYGGIVIIGASRAGNKGHQANWEENIASTILYNSVLTTNPMFILDGRNGKPSLIYGIKIEQTPPTTPAEERGGSIIVLDRAKDARVAYCTFINAYGVAVTLTNTDDFTTVTRAVVDHCTVDNPYKETGDFEWSYGFSVQGAVQYRESGFCPYTDEYWGNAIEVFGRWETAAVRFPLLYVEDCHLSRCRHATDNIQGGFYVARYNLTDKPIPKNFGQIDQHGSESLLGDTRPSYIGGRGFEAYNNRIIGYPGNYNNAAIWCRGGSLLIFNNHFINDYRSDYNILAELSNDDQANLYPRTHVNQTYIWDNVVENGVHVVNSGGYTQNVDYFLRPPSQAQDGFGYTPYPYPHPLTLEAPTTPWSGQLEEGTYRITMPTPVISNGQTYNFKQWEDGSTNPVRTITLTEDKTIIATYELVAPITYMLTITSRAGGTTNPAPGTYTYNEGTPVSVTAIPDADYRFVNWLLDGAVRTENPITVTMDSNHTLEAVFEYVPPPPLTATIRGYITDKEGNPIAGATVTCNGYADITEIDGAYAFVDVPAQAYTLTVTMTGYQSASIRVDASTGGTYPINLELTPITPPEPCFIATVTYGSVLANELNVLRRFRDHCLPYQITKVYYAIGPFLAQFIKRRNVIKRYVREVLNFMVKMVERVK